MAQPPAKRQRRAAHVPINHVHDGTEPRDKSRNCMLCRDEKVTLRHCDNPTVLPNCKSHPQCVWWSSNASCGWCRAVQGIVSHAVSHDKKRGMTSTMQHDHVNNSIGKSCYNCGYGPLTPMRENCHPRQLSMNRLHNAKPHDNDPEQTVPSCWQCNFGQSDASMDEFREMQVEMVAYAERDYMLTDKQNAEPVPVFPNHFVKSGKKRRRFAGVLISNKRFDCRRKCKVFEINQRQMEEQHTYQRGRCSLCSRLLGNDISFDQTVAGGEYRDGNFTLMHRRCNAFKGEWPIAEAYATAKRHVVYWMLKTK